MNFKLPKKELLIPIISGVISLALGFVISSAQINKGEYLEVTSRTNKLSSSLVEIDEVIINTKKQLRASNEIIKSLKSEREDLQIYLGIDIPEDIDDDEDDLDYSLNSQYEDNGYSIDNENYHYDGSSNIYYENSNSESISNNNGNTGSSNNEATSIPSVTPPKPTSPENNNPEDNITNNENSNNTEDNNSEDTITDNENSSNSEDNNSSAADNEPTETPSDSNGSDTHPNNSDNINE